MKAQVIAFNESPAGDDYRAIERELRERLLDVWRQQAARRDDDLQLRDAVWVYEAFMSSRMRALERTARALLASDAIGRADRVDLITKLYGKAPHPRAARPTRSHRAGSSE
jgi:hypothetical protein